MFRRGKLSFLHAKDDRLKIFSERINFTERHLIEWCSSFSTCARKMAKYRDSFDELSKTVRTLAEEDEINESLNEGLKQFSNAVTNLGDHMDLQVNRMELKIINEIALFEGLCKSTRDNLRTAVLTRDKEVLKQRQLLEIRSKFSGNNSGADSELLKAKLEVNRSNKEIDRIINNFEERKLNDLKVILGDFILLQMKYHAKCLETLTATYQQVENIDGQEDYERFQTILKTHNANLSARKSSMKNSARRSMSMESLDRERLMNPLHRSSRLSKSTKNLSSDVQSQSEDNLDGSDTEVGEEDEEGGVMYGGGVHFDRAKGSHHNNLDEEDEEDEEEEEVDDEEEDEEDGEDDCSEEFSGKSGSEGSGDSLRYDADKRVKLWRSNVAKKPTTTTTMVAAAAASGAGAAGSSAASSTTPERAAMSSSLNRTFQVNSPAATAATATTTSSHSKYPFRAASATTTNLSVCGRRYYEESTKRIEAIHNNVTFIINREERLRCRTGFRDCGGGDAPESIEGYDRLSLDLSDDDSNDAHSSRRRRRERYSSQSNGSQSCLQARTTM